MDPSGRRRAVSPLPSPVRRPLGLLAAENSINGSFALPSPKTPPSARPPRHASLPVNQGAAQQPVQQPISQPAPKNAHNGAAHGNSGFFDESTIRFFPGSAFRAGGNLSEISLSFLEGAGPHIPDDLVLPTPHAAPTPQSRAPQEKDRSNPAPEAKAVARPLPSLQAALSLDPLSPVPSVPLDLSQSEGARTRPSVQPTARQAAPPTTSTAGTAQDARDTPTAASLSFQQDAAADSSTPSPIHMHQNPLAAGGRGGSQDSMLNGALGGARNSSDGNRLLFEVTPIRAIGVQPVPAAQLPGTPAEQLRSQVQAWRQRYIEATQAAQQQQRRHEGEVEALRQEVAGLQRMVRQAEESSGRRVEARERETAEALQEMSALVQRLESEGKARDRELEASRGRVAELEVLLRTAREGEQEALRALEGKKAQVQILTRQLNEARAAAPSPAIPTVQVPTSAPSSAQDAKVVALQSEVARLTEQLRASTARCSSLEATLEEYDRALGEAVGQLDDLAEAKRALEDQLSGQVLAREEGARGPESPGKTVILSRALLRMSELYSQTRELSGRLEELTQENYKLARKHRDTLLQLKAAQQAPPPPVPQEALVRLQGRLDQALGDLQEERRALHQAVQEKALLESRLKALEGGQGLNQDAGAKGKAAKGPKGRVSVGSPIVMFRNPLTDRATTEEPSPAPRDATELSADLSVEESGQQGEASPGSPQVRFREEVARLRVARDEAVARASGLAEQVESQSRRLAHLQRLVREQSRSADLLDEREEELGQARRDLERARGRSRELESEVEARQRELEAARERLSEVQARVTELEFLYTGEAAGRAEGEAERAVLHEELARARQSQAEALRQVGEACAREREARGEVDRLKAELRRHESQLEEARGLVRELEGRVMALEEGRQELEGEVERWQAESRRAEEQVASLERDLGALRESMGRTEERCRALSEQLEEAVKGREEASKGQSEGAASVAQLSDEVSALREQLASLSAELDECYTCIGAADAEKAAMDQRIQSLSRELESAQALRSHLEARNLELTAERQAASQRAEGAESLVAGLRESVASLEAECRVLKGALEAEDRRKDAASGAVGGLEARVQAAERDREVLQSRLATALAEVAVQRNQAAALQSSLSALQQQNGQLKTKASCNAELMVLLGAMAERVAQCSEDLEDMDKLAVENERLGRELEDLRAKIEAPLVPSHADAATQRTPGPSPLPETPAVQQAPQTARGAARARALLSAIKEFTEAVHEVATPPQARGTKKTLSERFDEAKPPSTPQEEGPQVENGVGAPPPPPPGGGKDREDSDSPSIMSLVETLRVRMGRLNRLLGSPPEDDQPSPRPADPQEDAARLSSLARSSLVHELQSRCRVLQGQLDGERIERARMVALLKEGLEREGESERRVGELQAELDLALSEATRLKLRVEELLCQLEDREGAVARLEAHVRSLEASRVEAMEGGQGVRSRLAQAETERDMLAARLEEAQRSKAQLAAEVEGMRDTLKRELLRRGDGTGMGSRVNSRPSSRAASPSAIAREAANQEALERQRLRQDLTRVLAAEMGMGCAGDDDSEEDEQRRRGRSRGRSHSQARGSTLKAPSQARPPMGVPGAHTASRAASRAASLTRQASLSPVGRGRAAGGGFSGFPSLSNAAATPHRIGASSRSGSLSRNSRDAFAVPTAPSGQDLVPAEKYLRALKKAKKYKKEAEEAAAMGRRATCAQAGIAPGGDGGERTPLRQLSILDRLRGEVFSLRALMEQEEDVNGPSNRPNNPANRVKSGRSSSSLRLGKGERSFPATCRIHVSNLMELINDVAADGYWPLTPPPQGGTAAPAAVKKKGKGNAASAREGGGRSSRASSQNGRGSSSVLHTMAAPANSNSSAAAAGHWMP